MTNNQKEILRDLLSDPMPCSLMSTANVRDVQELLRQGFIEIKKKFNGGVYTITIEGRTALFK